MDPPLDEPTTTNQDGEECNIESDDGSNCNIEAFVFAIDGGVNEGVDISRVDDIEEHVDYICDGRQIEFD